MVERCLSTYKSQSIGGLILKVVRYLKPQRGKCYHSLQKVLSNSTGLEIGGPSRTFSKNGILPVYPLANRIDNCNFARKTVWEANIVEGMTFQFHKRRPPGRQYLCEATNLPKINFAQKYDYILASHVLEHIANPLKAISEWMRVVKDNGFIIIIVPHKDSTFDHKRPITTIEHLVEDFNRSIGEDDLTHLPEILELHDLIKDPGAGSFADFKIRSENNFENRCLHHHVFDTALLEAIFDWMNLRIQVVEPILPHHIIAIAHNISAQQLPNNHLINSRSRLHQADNIKKSPH
jgi:predicted SAM-dependent methyltransferase